MANTKQQTLDVTPKAFVPSKRAAATKALALRGRGKARIRYEKKPAKKDGNPFFAVRVPAGLLVAFRKLAAKRKLSATEMVRAYMSRATGIKVEVASDD